MATEKKPTESPLKIVKFEAENVKRLRAVSITPKKNLVEIRGRNGQGKTSILDSIMWAIGGLGTVQAEPIRKGQDSARIKLDMGDVIVTRGFKKREDGSTGSTITVESADGARWPQPQKMLDSLVGALSFDPLEWARMKPKDQFDAMRAFVPDYDFDAAAALTAGEFAKRADINRRAKEQATLAQTIAIPETTPTERIDEAAIVQEIGDVGAFNAEIERRKERRATARAEADALVTKANKMRQDAAALEQQAAEALGAAQAIDKKLDDAEALPAPKDAAEITARLEQAKTTNALIDAAARRQRHLDEAKRLEAEAEALTKSMTDREATKKGVIAKAKLPVENITFGEGQILFNGVPFDQASDADKLRTSVAIAMAGNPRLRVIRVRDGSLLDDEAVKIIAEMAKDKDYQVWLEGVDSSGKVGIVIEDGTVKSTPESRGDQPDLLA